MMDQDELARWCDAQALPGDADPIPAGPWLLLLDQAAASRRQLERLLGTAGFAVIAVPSAEAAERALDCTRFAHAVVELGCGRDGGLGLVRMLRATEPAARIVAVSAFDSFASVAAALRAGADDYLAKPVEARLLLDALHGLEDTDPPIPETPLALRRIVWEHVQRAFEHCGRNVTRTAGRLGMHRRTLQRVLSKHAPLPRAGSTRLHHGRGGGPHKVENS